MAKICVLFLVICITYIYIQTCHAKRIQYIITEHPEISWYDRTYIKYCNVTSRRHGRRDPFYYVGINFESVYEFHNNITVHFYFFEFLSNTYRRGFVEMHLKICDLVHKNVIFGSALKQGKLLGPCPFPAGVYNLSNMTIPLRHIPKNFPFRKGRIYANFTATATDALIARAHIDMEIKEGHVNVTNWVD